MGGQRKDGLVGYNRKRGHRVPVYFSDRGREELEALAGELDTTMSEVVRLALRELHAKVLPAQKGKR